jgi:hypothetical protein
MNHAGKKWSTVITRTFDVLFETRFWRQCSLTHVDVTFARFGYS